MDQNQNCFNPNILGFLQSSGSPPIGHAKVEEKDLKEGISEEEKKIRREIEREIERNLEEEIKGGIYKQALRLRRLYQNRQNAAVEIKPPPKTNKELVQLNISIKMKGPTKLEIIETKKEEAPPPETFRSDTAARTVPEVKRLDWVKSLRSSAPPPVVRKNVGFYRRKMPPKPVRLNWL